MISRTKVIQRVLVRRNHGLTHVSKDNQPRMVDVSGKNVTKRTATARSIVRLPPNVLSALQQNDELLSKKGPVLSTATIAGVMGAKRTSDLIPFCHPLPIENCQVSLKIHDDSTIHVLCNVSVTGRTGVEMEALTGASIAALCIYDMCKALSHDIVIQDTRLLEKTGGKADFKR
ncbi:molybdenum cofactor biosynthesis protein C [Thraustotheca clavata]|uniref:cyclic pyranopterin monophosphate synthase n=1 Tax=Thraustotheca clavata TaxID=74557 RepID=A0A1W0AC78_9STRA|nr:molybdenum cofactor biosynthesis protein C [Thraustotheca clavata]